MLGCRPPLPPRCPQDSIRYENTVQVDPLVYKNVQLFMKETAGGRSEYAALRALCALGG